MQKRIKNLPKIDAKSMLEKGMQKVWKIMPKWSQNGSQNPSKIPKKPEKRHAKNDAKIWCRKWSRKVRHFDSPWTPEVRRTSLRGWHCWLLLFETPDTGRCRRISGSLLAALWDPLCSFWHPSGSYWDPLGALLAHIGTVLVPFRARFGLFCTLGGLLLARFGRNSIFKAEICKKTLLHWPWY